MSIEMVLRAAEFAAARHRDQRRKDLRASPYINHPIAVARLISEVGGVHDAEVLAAALLHDTLEDTETTAQEIEHGFGTRVRDLVMEVSDDTSLSSARRKRHQIDGASRLSPGATLIKLADKTSNIRDIIDSPPKGWSLARCGDYLDWAADVVAGCPEVNPALEQLFWRTLEECRRSLDRAQGSEIAAPRADGRP
jgi:guanosine-3',5'-bis(diphosphate) 3'-pyrophosphohydrolase